MGRISRTHSTTSNWPPAGLVSETGLTAESDKVGKGDGADSHTSNWKDLEIRFTSEHHVQIFVCGRPGDSLNFVDMGFEDRRGSGGKPILAWTFLLELADTDGIYPAAKGSGDQTITETRPRTPRSSCEAFRIGWKSASFPGRNWI